MKTQAEYNRVYRRNHPDKAHASAKKYRQSEKGKVNGRLKSKRYHQRHKLQFMVRRKVRTALANGILSKPDKCEICHQAISLNGHHEDYQKPLEVMWLCPRCHNNIHGRKII